MVMCADCPWRGRAQMSVTASPRGPITAALAVVGMSPGNHEIEEGVFFAGGSGRMLAAALAQAKHYFSDVYCDNVVACLPDGVGGKELSAAQILACRERLVTNMQHSQARVVIALGGEALHALLGFKGSRQGISSWQGYLVEPGDAVPIRIGHTTLKGSAIPPATRIIVPVYHPAYIMRGGLREWAWFQRAISRAVRALNGELRVFTPPLADSEFPQSADAIGFDIETVGFSDVIEQIGISWT